MLDRQLPSGLLNRTFRNVGLDPKSPEDHPESYRELLLFVSGF